MGIFLFWIVMAGVVGAIAASKGRSFAGWFAYGFLIWPLALIHILLAPSVTSLAGAVAGPQAAIQGVMAERRPCPHCAELILSAATVCRYCGRDLPEPLKLVHQPLEDGVLMTGMRRGVELHYLDPQAEGRAREVLSLREIDVENGEVRLCGRVEGRHDKVVPLARIAALRDRPTERFFDDPGDYIDFLRVSDLRRV